MSNDFGMKDSGERRKFDSGAQRDRGDLKPRPDLISPFFQERLGWICAKGAEKYEPRNWEKGMPLSVFLESAERHLMQFKQGDMSEDHVGQAAWNLMCIIHFEELMKHGVHLELEDLPRYLTKREIDLPLNDPGVIEGTRGQLYNAAVLFAEANEHEKISLASSDNFIVRNTADQIAARVMNK